MSSERGSEEATGARAVSQSDGERKPLQAFALHALFLTLLLAAIPSADNLYPIFFARLADAVAAPFSGDYGVDFEWVRIGARTNRGEVVMKGIHDPEGAAIALWEIAFSVVERGYLPATLFLGLMIATPGALPRKIAATLGGLALLQLLLILQLGGLAISTFQETDAETFGRWLLPLAPLIEALFQSMLPRYVIVLALWAVLARPDKTIDWTPLTSLAPKPG